ncbi:xylulokinase [Roseibium sp. M-1]
MHLGLDIGTSGVKGVLLSDTFDVVGTRSSPLSVSRPHPGWSEQNPEDWIDACRKVILALKHDYGTQFSALKSIGLSGQMHGAVFLDEADRVLRPCILWNDSRSHIECAELEAAAPFRNIGGNIVMPGFTAPKVRWVEKFEPDVFRRTTKILVPKDFIRLWLTGEHVAEMSDAAGTLWLDVANRRWSPALLDATNLDIDAMPRLVEGTEQSGLLRSELAADWGTGQVPVAGGGGDNAATACGLGIHRPGTGFLSLGTSGVLFAACDNYSPNTDAAVHTFCHAIPKTWHHMGVVLSAADSLTWLGNITGRTAPDLTGLLPDRIERPSPVLFLPYLSGERTPHNFPYAAGTFTNLSMNAGLTDLVQAVLEGIGYAFADCKNALEAAGTQISEAFVVGGGTRSRQWLQIIANITGIDLLVPADGDFGAAFGAAKLGMACLSRMPLESIVTAPAYDQVIRPEETLKEAYAEGLQCYSGLFAGLRGQIETWNTRST